MLVKTISGSIGYGGAFRVQGGEPYDMDDVTAEKLIGLGLVAQVADQELEELTAPVVVVPEVVKAVEVAVPVLDTEIAESPFEAPKAKKGRR